VKQILKAKWDFSEPNIASALRKNKNGICAYCSNELTDFPAVGFGGLKICDGCRVGVDEMLEEFSKEIDAFYARELMNIVNGLKAD